MVNGVCCIDSAEVRSGGPAVGAEDALAEGGGVLEPAVVVGVFGDATTWRRLASKARGEKVGG